MLRRLLWFRRSALGPCRVLAAVFWSVSVAIIGSAQCGAQAVGSVCAGPSDALAFDALSKEYRAQTKELTSTVVFNVTNVSTSEVIIRHLVASCGCTAAQMSQSPRKLAPGDHGPITVTTDLRGKTGTLNKTVRIYSTAGVNTLQIKIVIPDSTREPESVRTQRQIAALANRQSVFQGDCAVCHAAPLVGKMGADLFESACSICHQPKQRASMVPDLATTSKSKGLGCWRSWISQGRPRTLMPGFAQSEGGPLTDAQIDSLVEYAAYHIR